MTRLESVVEELSRQNRELMDLIREYRVSLDHAGDAFVELNREKTALADALVWLLRKDTSSMGSDGHRRVSHESHTECVTALIQVGRATWIDKGISFTAR